VFPVTSIADSQRQSTSVECSGDPSNCMACANDTFGKEFCAAIGRSVAGMPSCANCPYGEDCGANCAAMTVPSEAISQVPQPPPIPSTTSPSEDCETIPTNTAWQQLKSHPNVEFSDLSLLADVVARRSKCMGPRVVISPAPGSITPERPPTPSLSEPEPQPSLQSILLTDPHSHYHEKERRRSSPIQLVPQDVLVRCGRMNIRQVQAAGVRDALRLLDSKFT
jgi:hypothetical protein